MKLQGKSFKTIAKSDRMVTDGLI